MTNLFYDKAYKYHTYLERETVHKVKCSDCKRFLIKLLLHVCSFIIKELEACWEGQEWNTRPSLEQNWAIMRHQSCTSHKSSTASEGFVLWIISLLHWSTQTANKRGENRWSMLVCSFTARSETCAGESASPQIWPPSHWSPSGWPPGGRILKGRSSGKNKQHGNVAQVCRLAKVGLHDSAWTHLQVRASERGPSQVAVLQFGVFQRGHSQVDSCHLTSLHVHTLKIGSYTHTRACTRTLIGVFTITTPLKAGLK